jgi:transposase-like protein
MVQERKYRKYTQEFRESALRRWELAANVTELRQELGISRTLLYWLREMEQREQEKQSQAAGQRLRRENTHLKKALAKKTLEVDFLKAGLRK